MTSAWLVIVTGLPGSGKTTRSRELEARIPAVRLCPDEWMEALGIDIWDQDARARIERLQGELADRLLALGQSVVIEWGTWARSERDALRELARSHGASVALVSCDAPLDVLAERISERGRESPPITADDLREWSTWFERPDDAELAAFDRLPFDWA